MFAVDMTTDKSILLLMVVYLLSDTNDLMGFYGQLWAVVLWSF